MKSLGMGAFALLAACFVVPLPASAAFYDWTLSAGDGLNGSGTLTTGPAAGGGFDITKVTGKIGGQFVTLLGGNPGGETLSPDGSFLYDNLLFPLGNPVVDYWGLLLTVAGDEGNVFGNGPGSYSYWTHNANGYDYSNGNVSFSIVDPPAPAVPEPASMALLGTGLLGLAALRRRRT